MFSALKQKLRSPQQSPQGHQQHQQTNGHDSAHKLGIVPLTVGLQKKFSRGVDYNLKLLLRGDRAAGKTALFNRLQGGAFSEDYVASEEIQVSAIQWNHKATDDIVKVEVWDVVDKGKKRIKIEGLKLSQGSQESESEESGVALDAQLLNVYKGSHGVIFLFDITKAWTFDYIKRELPKVPENIPVLVLANFMDKAHHRVITRDQRSGGGCPGMIKALADMEFLHKFLSLPYLALQRESLLRQLDTNDREIKGTQMELDLYLQSEDSNYERFLEQLTNKRRVVAEKSGPSPTCDIVAGKGQKLPSKSPSPQPPAPPTTSASQDEERLEKMIPAKPVAAEVPAESEAAVPSPSPTNLAADLSPSLRAKPAAPVGSPVKKGGSNVVDDFVPNDSSGIDSFLEDTGSPVKVAGMSGSQAATIDEESSSDEGGTNPMVARFAEEIDSEDEDESASNVKTEEYEQL